MNSTFLLTGKGEKSAAKPTEDAMVEWCFKPSEVQIFGKKKILYIFEIAPNCFACSTQTGFVQN